MQPDNLHGTSIQTKTLLLAVAVGWLQWSAHDARACSPPRNLSDPVAILATDTIDVPTNARIAIEWQGPGTYVLSDANVEIMLRPDVGTEQLLAIERHASPSRLIVIGTTAAPLLPSTRYEILVHRLSIYEPNCSQLEPVCPDFTVISSFTTSTVADTSPPVFAGVRDVSYWYSVCAGDCSCDFDWVVQVASLVWDTAVDDSSIAARYNVYRADTGALVLPMTSRASTDRLCEGNNVERGYVGAFSAEGGQFFVRAVDVAGNEDQNTVALPIVLDCTGAPNDASIGCTLVGRRQRTPLGVVVFGALCLLCVARTRSPR